MREEEEAEEEEAEEEEQQKKWRRGSAKGKKNVGCEVDGLEIGARSLGFKLFGFASTLDVNALSFCWEHELSLVSLAQRHQNVAESEGKGAKGDAKGDAFFWFRDVDMHVLLLEAKECMPTLLSVSQTSLSRTHTHNSLGSVLGGGMLRGGRCCRRHGVEVREAVVRGCPRGHGKR